MLHYPVKFYFGPKPNILDTINRECLIDDKAEESEFERIKNQRRDHDCSRTNNVSISFMVLYCIGILIKYPCIIVIA